MADSKVDIYMPLYIGDYLADTRELMAEEHGAYLLLLMAAWKRGGRLPKDEVFLRRMACVQPRRWQHVWGMIGRFFEEDGDALIQRGLMRRLNEVSRVVSSARKAGLASAQARLDRDGSNQPNPSKSPEAHPNGSPNGIPNGTQTPPPNGPRTLKSESDLDLDPEGGSDPPSPPAGREGPSSPWQWFERFKAAWFNAKGRQYAGSESDAKASGTLADMLRDLSDFERKITVDWADVMIALFLADDTARVVRAGHRFSWFIQDFNVLRLKADDQRRDEIAKRRGPKKPGPADGPNFWEDPSRTLGRPTEVALLLTETREKLASDVGRGDGGQGTKIAEPGAS